jgi:hypothetical protein
MPHLNPPIETSTDIVGIGVSDDEANGEESEVEEMTDEEVEEEFEKLLNI